MSNYGHEHHHVTLMENVYHYAAHSGIWVMSKLSQAFNKLKERH